MKKIYCILALIFSFIMVSCNTKVEGDAATVVDGEWYTAMTVDNVIVLEVFVDFDKGKFTLYQRSGSQSRFFIYKGTYTLVDGILSGKYDDSSSWGSDYKVTVDKTALLLESTNDSGEVNYYTPVSIPDAVKKNAVPALKSMQEEAVL